MRWIDYQEYRFLENFQKQREVAFALILLLTDRFVDKKFVSKEIAKLILKYNEIL